MKQMRQQIAKKKLKQDCRDNEASFRIRNEKKKR